VPRRRKTPITISDHKPANGNHLSYFPKTGYPLGYPEPALEQNTEETERGMVMSGSRCRFAYVPADATAAHYFLLQ